MIPCMVAITLLTASSTSLPVVVGVVSGPDFLSTWPGVIILSFLHYCQALMMAHSQCGCLGYHCDSYCLLPDSWLEAHSPFVSTTTTVETQTVSAAFGLLGPLYHICGVQTADREIYLQSTFWANLGQMHPSSKGLHSDRI